MGVTLNWLYSLPLWSLQNFEEVSDVFYNYYASRQDFKKNNNHLLILKTKQGGTFKCYISYFQSQMTLVYNSNDDVTTTAFIAGLQIDHFFYRHLVKHDDRGENRAQKVLF